MGPLKGDRQVGKCVPTGQMMYKNVNGNKRQGCKCQGEMRKTLPNGVKT